MTLRPRGILKRGLQAGPPALGVAGLAGSLACVAAMVLAALGIAGVGAASLGASADMAGMGSQANTASAESLAVLVFLIERGPAILLVSIAAIVLSLAAQRREAVIPGLLGGGILYWGMYAQDRLFIMYASIVIGLLVWATAYAWAHGKIRRGARRTAA